MPGLKCISGEKLVYLASTTANIMAQGLDINDINILSAFFTILGDSLNMISVQRTICSSSQSQDSSNSCSAVTTNQPNTKYHSKTCETEQCVF